MQECRNWQTSKTKDLVSNALVWVQVPSPAPDKYYPNQQRQILPVGDGFGFILFLGYNYFPNGVQIKSTSKPRGPRKKK